MFVLNRGPLLLICILGIAPGIVFAAYSLRACFAQTVLWGIVREGGQDAPLSWPWYLYGYIASWVALFSGVVFAIAILVLGYAYGRGSPQCTLSSIPFVLECMARQPYPTCMSISCQKVQMYALAAFTGNKNLMIHASLVVDTATKTELTKRLSSYGGVELSVASPSLVNSGRIMVNFTCAQCRTLGALLVTEFVEIAGLDMLDSVELGWWKGKTRGKSGTDTY